MSGKVIVTVAGQLALPFTPFVCRCGRAVQIDRRFDDGVIVQNDGQCRSCGRVMNFQFMGSGWVVVYEYLPVVSPLVMPKKYLRLWQGHGLDEEE